MGLSQIKGRLQGTVHVWGNLVTWRSKKQAVVSRSSAETKFKAMAQGICDGIWLRRLLTKLKTPMDKTMKLFCDNQAAISIAKILGQNMLK